jgi:AcrR family transcriptional regulator
MSRKDELRAGITEWVLGHGVGGLSLRPLANALETSTYSLVYWFGSREGVVAAALETAEEHQREMVVAWVEEAGVIAPGDLLRRYWKWSASEKGTPYVKLFLEVVGLAQHEPSLLEYVERAVHPWRNLLEGAFETAGLSPRDAAREATLLNASVVGLQLDFATNRDPVRTSAGAEGLAERLDKLGRIPIADWTRPLSLSAEEPRPRVDPPPSSDESTDSRAAAAGRRSV